MVKNSKSHFPTNHNQPLAAIANERQPLAAIANERQPLAAIANERQPLAAVANPNNNTTFKAPAMKIEQTFSCAHCSKVFQRKSNLTTHTRIHTGERPFACEVDGCEWRFSDASALRTHLRVHSGDKPYECREDGCGKTFSHLSSLQYHVRLHTGDKPYKCDICDKTFNRSSNRNTHLKVHSDEKAHKCNLCAFATNRATSLVTHKRNKHRNETTEQVIEEQVAEAASSPVDSDIGSDDSNGDTDEHEELAESSLSAIDTSTLRFRSVQFAEQSNIEAGQAEHIDGQKNENEMPQWQLRPGRPLADCDQLTDLCVGLATALNDDGNSDVIITNDVTLNQTSTSSQSARAASPRSCSTILDEFSMSLTLTADSTIDVNCPNNTTTFNKCLEERHKSTPGFVNQEDCEELIVAHGGFIVHDRLNNAAAETLDNCFLVTDVASRSDEYLMALAMSVPCVSFNKVYEAIEMGKVERKFEHLMIHRYLHDGVTVDAPWHDRGRHLLADTQLLLYGQSAKSMGALVRMMGANTAQHVTQLTHGSILVTDSSCPPAMVVEAKVKGAAVVNIEWLMNSLIAGELLDKNILQYQYSVEPHV